MSSDIISLCPRMFDGGPGFNKSVAEILSYSMLYGFADTFNESQKPADPANAKKPTDTNQKDIKHEYKATAVLMLTYLEQKYSKEGLIASRQRFFPCDHCNGHNIVTVSLPGRNPVAMTLQWRHSCDAMNL
jgi:hypothetical protein